MSAIIAIYQASQTLTNVVTTTYTSTISVIGSYTYAAQCAVDVNTPTNKTFASTAVDVDTEVITVAAHGYTTGLKVQISNPGTLPTGISPTTDYFVINLTTNTLQLASSLANALAGTPINISAQGSGTNTVEVTALAGANVKLQKSNDGTVWTDEGSPTNITVDANLWLGKLNPEGAYMRVAYTATAGSFTVVNLILVKGPN